MHLQAAVVAAIIVVLVVRFSLLVLTATVGKENGRIPQVPDVIPFIGQAKSESFSNNLCVLSRDEDPPHPFSQHRPNLTPTTVPGFGEDLRGFLSAQKSKYGEVFKTTVAGNSMTFVTQHAAFAALMKNGKLRFEPVVSTPPPLSLSPPPPSLSLG
jgi:hypothetical protein